MTSIPLHGANPVPEISISPEALSRGRVLAILSITVFLALAAYYFVGVDEGMTSLFGKTMVIHEWVHDSRHFLGFPCH
ncbi:CbtB-domain containing protein [Actinospica durhamensis]|uniref:CbtB-domain containing protein n=1 Tax=Actinospica durhamensis TaxID=1508375 RepID=A0A941ETN5_9ACTN|nr:CbtB-domain containing protein [Actinospica durhamensis]MBR7837415.1 CbtB-domain containing protein [Actinospica durhamensis]